MDNYEWVQAAALCNSELQQRKLEMQEAAVNSSATAHSEKWRHHTHWLSGPDQNLPQVPLISRNQIPRLFPAGKDSPLESGITLQGTTLM